MFIVESVTQGDNVVRSSLLVSTIGYARLQVKFIQNSKGSQRFVFHVVTISNEDPILKLSMQAL